MSNASKNMTYHNINHKVGLFSLFQPSPPVIQSTVDMTLETVCIESIQQYNKRKRKPRIIVVQIQNAHTLGAT